MKDETLFLNGVYKSVLEEIRAIQEVLPEQIMFLQPYCLRVPFSVARLVKSDGEQMSDHRTTAGGWAYVQTVGVEALLE